MRAAVDIADRALAAPAYHGTTARAFLLEEAGRAGDLAAAAQRMASLADATQKVFHDLQLELATLEIAKGTPLEAAAWFLENVPLDASWRSEAFFALRERIRE